MSSRQMDSNAEQLRTIVARYLEELLGTEIESSTKVEKWQVRMVFHDIDLGVEISLDIGYMTVWQAIQTSIGPGPLCRYQRTPTAQISITVA